MAIFLGGLITGMVIGWIFLAFLTAATIKTAKSHLPRSLSNHYGRHNEVS